jgi:prepilin signal peptidase PulO-like enzyme (type II secretory pathway)
MVYILLALLGLALGSFINALVWRLHESEKTNQKKSSKNNLSILNGRSMCVHCKYVLAWYDLVPVFSWLQLKGRCRYCGKPIDDSPLIESLMAVLLLVSFIFWPFELSSSLSYILFGVWAIILTVLLALALYDLKWMILPTRLVYIIGGLSIIFTGIRALEQQNWGTVISSIVGSVGLGGLFWVIYQVSQGKWIGGGDVRFGFVMGLLLGWQKAIFGLTAAAYIGLAVIIALLVIGKYHRKMKLPFGPMLIAGTYVSVLWGQWAIDIYKGLSGL